ncbi:uncharacterized protein LOC114967272 [Acropora millepora]|uniref:uncharacterized protein LOC114967272 n=1 Tax=Acropora millepora TaxID=45264 RepID=UPI001CF413D4|nr:uncharacterized protein LOC114967272 [Acropora millepora]
MLRRLTSVSVVAAHVTINPPKTAGWVGTQAEENLKFDIAAFYRTNVEFSLESAYSDLGEIIDVRCNRSKFHRVLEASKANRCKMFSKMVQEQSISGTIKTWHSQLSTVLEVKPLPPKAIKSAFQDASKLFGTNFDKKVTLRDAGHLGANEDIILYHFDPNFASTDVYCRHPSCGNKNPKAAKEGKRDLYLCPLHRKNLITAIENALARKKINNPKNTEVPEEEQFTGYTSLIGLLERTLCHNSNKFGRFKEESTPMIKEAILNVRNVLIITNTVLNPDLNNLALIIPYVYKILELIVNNHDKCISIVAGLVSSLKEVIEIILSGFGVMYRWVSVAPTWPGRQIRAVLGGAIGLAAGLFFGPVGAAFGGMAAGFLGGLTGNGEEQDVRESRQQVTAGRHGDRTAQTYRVFFFEGDVSGRLYLRLLPAN